MTSIKRSHVHTATLSAPNSAAGHHWPTPLLETPEHSWKVWVSLLLGHCSFLLGPGTHKVLFVPSKSLFPQSCASSLASMVGLMATSSKRAYAIPSSTMPRAPAPAAVHCWPVPPQETLKHSSVSVPVWSLGRGAHKVCLSPLSFSGGMRFDSKHDFVPPTILLGLLLAWTMNRELPDVQVGFRKGRGTRDQIANIRWNIETARVPGKHLFLLYWLCQSLLLCGSQKKLWKILKEMGIPDHLNLPPEKSICRSRSNS